ncbi:hypothetical protein [Pseudolabrys sp. Root1462]|uniref:hypothetical protein n=1 Tax=Pseudolabrys sp. Root1462 TaxID=1736466 RepID=UPI0012E3B795|nr:hypothetical protein [Pseudolabrys sp. Root1462]
MASRDWTALIMASMSANENSALRREASAATVAEDDYQSFCQALGASARGRAFLQEYARRNRHADTEVVLEALNRLEETARTQKPAADGDRIRQDLRALLDTLRTAKPQTENSPSAIKAATLSALIDFTQARLEALVTMPDELRALEALAAVPPPEQPELPIPQPLAAAPAAPVALVQTPRVAEAPVAEKAAPVAKAPEAIVIPKVEFDYHAQQAARPASAPGKAEAPEQRAAWSELSPPPVAAPKVEAKIEAKSEPKIELKAEPPELKAAPEAPAVVAEPTAAAPSAATFEPVVAAAPAAAAEQIAPPAVKPQAKIDTAPASTGESGRIAAAGEVETYELWLDDLTVEAEVTIAGDDASHPAPQLPTPPITQMAPAASAGMTITAIEALVEQLQRPTPPGAAPLTIGKIEVADPLAPILSLSDDERIALFT